MTRDVIDNAIEAVKLAKSYNGPMVVDHIDFSVKRGEFVTLLGPSGSGKTSTLMMVAGFEQPTGGDILLHGRSVLGVPPKSRELGIVFQSYALFPHMTVLENVAFPLRMRHIGKAVRLQRAKEMLARVHLKDLIHRRPKELSGGQQQRVALARALVFEPAALLLDEPLGALDKRLRDQLQIEIKSIQKSLGVSVLFVTHDQAEAMMMSDRIAVMNNGQIEQIGPPEVIYSRPSSTFVATFLGETNLIPCRAMEMTGEFATVQFDDGSHSCARVSVTAREHGEKAVSVRPERIRLLSGSDTAQCVVDGVLVSHTFLGSSHRLIVEALGRKGVVVLPDSTKMPAFQLGSHLRLGWNHEDAELLTMGEMVGNEGRPAENSI